MRGDYNDAIGEWNRVRARRAELNAQRSEKDSEAQRVWLSEMELLDTQQGFLEMVLGAFEIIMNAEYENSQQQACEANSRLGAQDA